jgi:hypothetical protein
LLSSYSSTIPLPISVTSNSGNHAIQKGDA